LLPPSDLRESGRSAEFLGATLQLFYAVLFFCVALGNCAAFKPSLTVFSPPPFSFQLASPPKHLPKAPLLKWVDHFPNLVKYLLPFSSLGTLIDSSVFTVLHRLPSPFFFSIFFSPERWQGGLHVIVVLTVPCSPWSCRF